MNRRTVLLSVLLLALLLPVVSLGGSGTVALGTSLGALPSGSQLHGLSAASQTIPNPICPLPPVNTSIGQVNCFTTLDLTEVLVILIGLTITFYVYKDADKAELPGDAAYVPVTAQEELEVRLRRESEAREREQLEHSHP
jgi:hypothetical protein